MDIGSKFVGAGAAFFLAVWVVGYLFHLHPVDTRLWWALPWVYTVLGIGVAIVVAGGVLGDFLYRRSKG